jgi:hypothetical protein
MKGVLKFLKVVLKIIIVSAVAMFIFILLSHILIIDPFWENSTFSFR